MYLSIHIMFKFKSYNILQMLSNSVILLLYVLSSKIIFKKHTLRKNKKQYWVIDCSISISSVFEWFIQHYLKHIINSKTKFTLLKIPHLLISPYFSGYSNLLPTTLNIFYINSINYNSSDGYLDESIFPKSSFPK